MDKSFNNQTDKLILMKMDKSNIDKVCHIHINPKNTAKSHNKNGSPDAKVPSYKFDEVKLENKINHFDKYRRERGSDSHS